MADSEHQYGWGERIVMPLIWCAVQLTRTRGWKWLSNLAGRLAAGGKK